MSYRALTISRCCKKGCAPGKSFTSAALCTPQLKIIADAGSGEAGIFGSGMWIGKFARIG